MPIYSTERIRRPDAPRHLWVRLNRSSRERYARLGRDFELHVESILRQMVSAGDIIEYIRHEPRSDEDLHGRDFTILTLAGNEVSFGVTRSARHWNDSKARYRDIAQWWFPYATSDETIRRKILRLAREYDDSRVRQEFVQRRGQQIRSEDASHRVGLYRQAVSGRSCVS